LDRGPLQSIDTKMPTATEDTILHWNCARGIFNKKHVIEKYITNHQPIVFFISESDVTDNHYLNTLNISGYIIEIAQTFETRKKGRVLAYVKKNSGLVRKTSLESPYENLIVLENSSTIIVGLYSGFKVYEGETVISNFRRLIDHLEDIASTTEKRIIIGGDFNACPKKNDEKSKLLNLWSASTGMVQMVKDSTRERLVSDVLQISMIDLVYANDPEVISVQCLTTEESDHKIVCVKVKANKAVVINQKKVVVDWRKYTNDRFNSVLSEKCNFITCSELPGVLNREITCAITAAMNELIPLRTIRLRRTSDLDSPRVAALKKKRDRMLKKAKRSGSVDQLKTVRDLNIEIKWLVKNEKKNFIKNKLKNSSTAGFWHSVNSLLGRNNNDGEFPIKENEIRLPPEDVPDRFADFFVSKVKKLLEESDIEDLTVDGEYVPIEPFTAEEIDKALETFKPKKSSGPDDIPMMLLKDSKVTLVPWFKKLFNLIADKNIIPSEWKVARLKPIYKKGDRSSVTNYRPVSNLNSISKIFERCLLNRLPSGIDGINQHGFRANHSTTTACMELQTTISSLLDQKRPCVTYSVDLSSAFDLILPGQFYHRALKTVDKSLARIIYNFISNRKGFVEIEGETSVFFDFPAGCPQGSTLGPRVFNIYCNELNDRLENSNTSVTTYADDTYVTVWSRSNTVEEVLFNTKEALTKHLA